MLSYPLTVNPTSSGGTSVDKTFTVIDTSAPYRTVSSVADDALTEPYTLEISSTQSTPKGANYVVNNHLVKTVRTIQSAVHGSIPITAQVVLRVPVGVSEVDLVELKNQFYRLNSLIRGAGVFEAILNRES